ncbi:MAG: GNAT family N-acetyltransferase [Marivibrio sp.]|uniref:GNAT family N-acetyltransferase n=1 Tax=Marivibrio sp. TaxID=2039719 RepID=UPI0032ECCCC7
MTVEIAAESPDQGAIGCLIRESDAYYASLYPPEQNHLLDTTELSAPGVTFLVARCDGVVAGFGAIAVRDDDETPGARYGEIKRMYVAPAMRGAGLGRKLLEALEARARALDLPRLLLETGTLQPEALALYRTAGFEERGPFAGYPDEGFSLFFEKRL